VQSTTGNNQIRRRIGPFTATSIVIANIIGAGIFTTTGIMAARLPGPGWVLLCWICGGLIALAGSLCYTELATRMPAEGGEYVYLRTLYHPVLGFLTGWTSFIVGFSAAIAASAMGFSEYLFSGLPGGVSDPSHLMLYKKTVAGSIILLFTVIHYLGIRIGSGVQNGLTLLKIVIVLGLASIGLLTRGAGDLPISIESPDSFEWQGVGTAMMLVMFAYSGWNASAYIAGELKQPKRTLPVSLIAGTSIVIVLYLLVNVFVLTAVPYSELRGSIPVVEQASVRAFGGWTGRGLSVMISLALLSSLSAFILIGPRVYYAMACDRLFFRFAGKVHPRFGVPGVSIVIQGAISMLMVWMGTFEQLLVYLGFALGLFPWLSVAGLFIARKKRIGDDGAVPVPAFPFLPLFFLASTLFLMIIAFINRPMESSAAICTVLAGLPCYAVWRRLAGSQPQ
jgi:APA family basic amino acid/polyamine antiporter